MTVFRWILGVALIGVVTMVVLGGMKPRPAPKTRVQLTKAEKMSLTRNVSGAGKLEPISKVSVSSNITGVLLDLKVGIGSEVKKGQYLGQIDTSRYAAQVDQQRAGLRASQGSVASASANLARLRKELSRVESLAERGVAGSAEVDSATSAVRVAEADLAAAQSRSQVSAAAVSEAQKNVEWATLVSPVDGTVLSVNKRVGERIRGSDFSEDVVLVIGQVASFTVRIEVGEMDVVWIKPGQKATIEIDALPDVPVKGEVIDMGRDAIVKNAGTDNEVTAFPVWIELEAPPPGALSGMSAQVTIATETKENVLSLPIQAVTMRPPGMGRGGPGGPPGEKKPEEAKADEKKPEEKKPEEKKPGGPGPGGPGGPGKFKLEKVVFVFKDGKVEKRKVQTGLSSESHVEIISGVSDGEQVVEGPYRVLARELEDGAEVDTMEGMGGGRGMRGGGGGGGPR